MMVCVKKIALTLLKQCTLKAIDLKGNIALLVVTYLSNYKWKGFCLIIDFQISF